MLVACGESEEKAHLADAKTSYNEEKAELIYTTMCAICHGSDGKLGYAGAKNLTESTLDLSARIALIKYGKGQMTPFENRLTREEMEWVAMYIESLRP